MLETWLGSVNDGVWTKGGICLITRVAHDWLMGFEDLFRSSMPGSTAALDDPAHGNRLKGPIIEELERETYLEKRRIRRMHRLIKTHSLSTDQADDHIKSKSESNSKELTTRPGHSEGERELLQKRSVSFQRVTYGGHKWGLLHCFNNQKDRKWSNK